MNYFLNKLKALLSICIVSFMSIALSQNVEEKTPLWIEKGDIISDGRYLPKKAELLPLEKKRRVRLD